MASYFSLKDEKSILDVIGDLSPGQEFICNNFTYNNHIILPRRYGKTHLAKRITIHYPLLRCPQKNPVVLITAPELSQCKGLFWDDMSEMLRNFDGFKEDNKYHNLTIKRNVIINGKKHDDYLRLEFRGFHKNPNAMRGFSKVLHLGDEWQHTDVTAYKSAVWPMLRDPKIVGGFYGVSFKMGTALNGHMKEEFYECRNAMLAEQKAGVKHPSHFAFRSSIDLLQHLSKEAQAEAMAAMGSEEYAQEYKCEFMEAGSRQYYYEEMRKLKGEGRLTPTPWTIGHKVTVAMDIGRSDYTAIWFSQRIQGRVHLIDYFQGSGETPESICQLLLSKGYSYDFVGLPHDSGNKYFTPGQTCTTVDYFKTFKQWEVIKLQRGSLIDGINLVRGFLNRCYIDPAKTFRGVQALCEYSKKWDNKEKVFLDKQHAKTAYVHGADGLRYLAQTYSVLDTQSRWGFASSGGVSYPDYAQDYDANQGI